MMKTFFVLLSLLKPAWHHLSSQPTVFALKTDDQLAAIVFVLLSNYIITHLFLSAGARVSFGNLANKT